MVTTTGVNVPIGPSTGWATDTPRFTINVCGNFLGLKCTYSINSALTSNNYLGACSVMDDMPPTYYNFITTFASGWTMTLFQTHTDVFTTTELGCYNELFSFPTCLKDGVLSACPSNLAAAYPGTFSFNPITFTDVGVWTITMHGYLAGLPPYSADYTFTVTVTSDCVNTVLDATKVISPMTVAVNGPTVTQDITWPDSIGTNTHTNQAWCGNRKYTFTGAPAFMTFTNTTTPLISLTTTNPAHAGSYTVSAEICLYDFPNITPACVTKTFVITCTCTVTSVSFSTLPVASTSIEIGVDP
jgi:hypothetical protein